MEENNIKPVKSLLLNRRMRRALWKEDQKFLKKYKKQIDALEKYVDENGIEALNEWLENKNKIKGDENK